MEPVPVCGVLEEGGDVGVQMTHNGVDVVGPEVESLVAFRILRFVEVQAHGTYS